MLLQSLLQVTKNLFRHLGIYHTCIIIRIHIVSIAKLLTCGLVLALHMSSDNSLKCAHVCVFVTENLPRLLKEIMQEAKQLTDAEWCVVATYLSVVF